MDPTTQGQQGEAEISQGQSTDQGANTQSQQQSTPNPVQQRIDELTAKFRDQERMTSELAGRLQEASQQNAAMVAMLAQQGQQNQPQEAALPEGFDPQVKAVIDQKLAAVTGQFSRALQSLQAQFGTQMVTMQVAQAAQPFGPEVVQRAQQMVNNYARQGTVLDPNVATQLAIGQLAMEGKSVAQQSEAQRRAGQAAATQGVAGGVRQPNVAGGGQQPVAEDVIASWPVDRQVAYWESQVDPNALLFREE